MGAPTPTAAPRPTGAAVAAFLAAAIGLLTLGVVVLVTELSDGAREFVFAVGKAWIPGASDIGPYSGKETFLLAGWLGSWIVLHVLLRHRNVGVRWSFGFALALILVAGVLIWPPAWHALGA